jgi:putative FmdB family regulatory protein
MPHYDYECTKCGHRFEVFQKMSDKPLKECPSCKGLPRRLIGSGAGVIFKGSGFYATDYKKQDTSKAKEPAPAAPPTCPSSGGKGCASCPHAS